MRKHRTTDDDRCGTGVRHVPGGDARDPLLVSKVFAPPDMTSSRRSSRATPRPRIREREPAPADRGGDANLTVRATHGGFGRSVERASGDGAGFVPFTAKANKVGISAVSATA